MALLAKLSIKHGLFGHSGDGTPPPKRRPYDDARCLDELGLRLVRLFFSKSVPAVLEQKLGGAEGASGKLVECLRNICVLNTPRPNEVPGHPDNCHRKPGSRRRARCLRRSVQQAPPHQRAPRPAVPTTAQSTITCPRRLTWRARPTRAWARRRRMPATRARARPAQARARC